MLLIARVLWLLAAVWTAGHPTVVGYLVVLIATAVLAAGHRTRRATHSGHGV